MDSVLLKGVLQKLDNCVFPLRLVFTEHLVGSREGLGMLDKDSPIWASDHFAVVADLKIAFSD
jgi:hypothetical protein